MLTRTALLAVVVLATTTPAAAGRTCTPAYNQATLTGNQLDGFVGNADQCRAKCVANNDCLGYAVFGAANAAQTCVLLSTINSETYTPNVVVASARCMDATSTRLLLLPQEKFDYPGLDIANAPASNPTDCSYKCQDTQGCSAYSWSNYNGGTCWMKSAKPDKVVATPDGSVVSGEVYTCQRPHLSSDATGVDLSNVLRAKYTDCCGVCRRTDKCAGFSWSNYNGGTCWLKSSITGFASNAGVTSALL